MLLEVDDLHAAYSDLSVVNGVSFSVDPGRGVAILGGNGAGKSTTLRCLSGLARTTRGAIRFDGQNITGLPAHQIAALGIALVPEGRHLFPDHTVGENLELGGYRLLRARRRDEFGRRLAELTELFPLIAERYNQPAGQLSGGEQQMIAIARALIGRPRALLLDEPSLGLSPRMVTAVFHALAQLKKSGLALVVAEQAAPPALACCESAIVLQGGRIVVSSPSEKILAHPALVDAYLGVVHSAGEPRAEGEAAGAGA